MSAYDDMKENRDMLYDPNYSGPKNGYGMTGATVSGEDPSLGDAYAISGNSDHKIDYSQGGVAADYTGRGANYAGIGYKYGGRDTGTAGSDVGSADYQQDIWRQRMYETGGSTWEVDPNSQFLGGREGWADDYFTGSMAQAQGYAGRQQPWMNTYDADMSGAQGNLMQADMARMAGAMGQAHAWNDLNAMSGDLGGIRAMAMGHGQSAAEMAMQRQAEETFRQNMAMASTARGAGANAALLQAAQANAVGQGQLNRDLGIQRASEQQDWTSQLLQGSGQYMNAQDALIDNYGNMRGQDLDAAMASGQLSLDQARLLADQEATRYGGAIDTQAANDQMVQFFISQGMDAQQAQLAARQAFEANRTSNWLNKYATDAGIEGDPTFMDEWGKPLIGAGVSGAAYGFGSGLTSSSGSGDSGSSDDKKKKK